MGAPTAGGAPAAARSQHQLVLWFVEQGCDPQQIQEVQEMEAVSANSRSCIQLFTSVQGAYRSNGCPQGPAKLIDMLKSAAARLDNYHKTMTDIASLEMVAASHAASDEAAKVEQAVPIFAMESTGSFDGALDSAAADEVAACSNLAKRVAGHVRLRNPVCGLSCTASAPVEDIMTELGVPVADKEGVRGFLRRSSGWSTGRLGDFAGADADTRRMLAYAAAVSAMAVQPIIEQANEEFGMFLDNGDDSIDISKLQSLRETMFADALAGLDSIVSSLQAMGHRASHSSSCLRNTLWALVPTLLCRHRRQLSTSTSRLQVLVMQHTVGELQEARAAQGSAIKQLQEAQAAQGSAIKQLQEAQAVQGSAAKQMREDLLTRLAALEASTREGQATTAGSIEQLRQEAIVVVQQQDHKNVLFEQAHVMNSTVMQASAQSQAYLHGEILQAQAAVAQEKTERLAVQQALADSVVKIQTQQAQQGAEHQALAQAVVRNADDTRSLKRKLAEVEAQVEEVAGGVEGLKDGPGAANTRRMVRARTAAASPLEASIVAAYGLASAAGGGDKLHITSPGMARSPLGNCNMLGLGLAAGPAAHSWLAEGGAPLPAAAPSQPAEAEGHALGGRGIGFFSLFD